MIFRQCLDKCMESRLSSQTDRHVNAATTPLTKRHCGFPGWRQTQVTQQTTSMLIFLPLTYHLDSAMSELFMDFTVHSRAAWECAFDRSRSIAVLPKDYAKVDSIRRTSSRIAMNLSPSTWPRGRSGRRGVML